MLDVCREVLKLKDGGQVALDWLEDGCPANAPIIIILPGLTGHSQSQYIRCLVLAANCIKLRAVVFNYRGLGGISLKVILENIIFEQHETDQMLIWNNLLHRYAFLVISLYMSLLKALKFSFTSI
jgi:predicted alpha/beta-fold hydrolase